MFSPTQSRSQSWPAPFRVHGLMLAAALAVLVFVAGCNVLGVVASKLPQPPEPAKVNLSEGLAAPDKKDQAPITRTVAIMVWTDRGINVDWPSLRGDLPASLLARLKKAQTEKANTLEAISFPYSAEQVVRWQRDNPAADAMPVTEVAKLLKVDRLIYIEVLNFQTRTTESYDLFRGDMTVSLKVVDAKHAGGAKVIYDEADIASHFPRTAPPEGTPRGSDAQMYVGVVNETADELARRFVATAPKE